VLQGAPPSAQGRLFKPLLADPDPRVQAGAARALHEAGTPGMVEWLVLASARAGAGEARVAYEDALAALSLTQDAREAILAKAGITAGGAP
jgi:hypothetical protein